MAPTTPQHRPGGRPTGNRPPVRRRPRPSRATIIKRRLVALAILLALIALLAFGITALVRALTSDPEPTEPAASPSSTLGACRLRDVTMESRAGDVVEGDANDVTVTFTNEGEDPCTLEAGREHLTLTVSSGGVTAYSSEVCEDGPLNRPLLLDGGASNDIVLTWDGTTSGEACAADAETAAPGTYRYDVSLDGGLTDSATALVQPRPDPAEPGAGASPTGPDLGGRPAVTPTPDATEDAEATGEPEAVHGTEAGDTTGEEEVSADR